MVCELKLKIDEKWSLTESDFQQARAIHGMGQGNNDMHSKTSLLVAACMNQEVVLSRILAWPKD